MDLSTQGAQSNSWELQVGFGDVGWVLAFAVAFPLVRWALERAVLKPLAAHWVRLPKRHAASAGAAEHKMRRERFAESGWKLLAYGASSAFTLRLLATEEWGADSAAWWRGWPAGQQHSAALLALYRAQLGFYLAGVWMLVAWETRRKDHAIMMSHHLATIALIGLSYGLRFLRVGAVIMALHDVNDVLLEAAKCSRYCEREGAATAFLAAFVVSWVATRLTLFPCVVIRSVIWGGPAVMGHPPPLHALFSGLLLLLLAMHVYWFWLILKIALRKLASGTVQDSREDGVSADSEED